MDKILFKGVDIKKKIKKPRSYIIKNNIQNYTPSKIFEIEYQNIIHPLINNNQSFIIKNYKSINRIQNTIEVLKFSNHKSILLITKDKSCFYENVDISHEYIYDKKYTFVIMDKCFVDCDLPYIIFSNKDLYKDIPEIKFLYRFKFINGTREKIKHLVIDQLIEDPKNTLIYTKDKAGFIEKYEDYNVTDNITEIVQYKRIIFYDLYNDIKNCIKLIEWSDNLTVFCIYTLDQEEYVKEYIKEIESFVCVDKQTLEYLKINTTLSL